MASAGGVGGRDLSLKYDGTSCKHHQAGADSRQNPSNGRASILPPNEFLSREPNSRTRAHQKTSFRVRHVDAAKMLSRKEGQHGSHRTIERIAGVVRTYDCTLDQDNACEIRTALLRVQGR